MAKPKGGLTKWFKEKWVDISRPKKGGGSAIRRKRAAGNPGGKPTMVKTFTKRKARMRRGGKKKR